MRKVLLIGKINAILHDINNYISPHFKTQLCMDNFEMARGILRLNQPDFVFINLVGLEDNFKGILDELRYNYSHLPVLCLSVNDEHEKFWEYFRSEHFHTIKKPENNELILDKINELMEYYYSGEDKEKSIETKKKVLIVDDSPIQLRTINEMLKEKYEVQMVGSGLRATYIVKTFIPDIILLDYEMPICDGKRTLELLQALEEAKDIPVVFLTGVRDKEHIQAVLELKPAGYLLKPANADLIRSTIEKVLSDK